MKHAETIIISLSDLKGELEREYGGFFKNLTLSKFRDYLINGNFEDSGVNSYGSYLIIDLHVSQEGGIEGLISNSIKAFLRREFAEARFVLVNVILEENWYEC